MAAKKTKKSGTAAAVLKAGTMEATLLRRTSEHGTTLATIQLEETAPQASWRRAGRATNAATYRIAAAVEEAVAAQDWAVCVDAHGGRVWIEDETHEEADVNEHLIAMAIALANAGYRVAA